ncbi:hypothetical protein ABT346_27695 [Micromonospora peucetia]|uniref:hypothetical protein n=1 Tax=Micromonospora peucetia TaxID=47871 RepID=UPI00331C73EA
MMRTFVKRAVLPLVAALTAILALASPAQAQDDSWSVYTTGSTNGGRVDFIDYGPGAPGGGNNDDYLEIYDLRADGHGVQVWAWLHGKYLGTKYNGNGESHSDPLIWDPYKIFPNNVAAGERIGLKICLVNGPDNLIQSTCGSYEWHSQDG